MERKKPCKSTEASSNQLAKALSCCVSVTPTWLTKSLIKNLAQQHQNELGHTSINSIKKIILVLPLPIQKFFALFF
jgi:hypothetical protein